MQTDKAKQRKTSLKKQEDVRLYTCDFETCNAEDNITKGITRVWLGDICEFTEGEYTHRTFNNISAFFAIMEELAPCKIYFHNLAFDGSFIIDYALNNGYTWAPKPSKNVFTTLINDNKVFYSITFKFGEHTVEIRDSLKKIPLTIANIAKSYELPTAKGEIDYTMYRRPSYKPTKKEVEYVKTDTEIAARALFIHYQEKMTFLTVASDTFNLYKESRGALFSKDFPTLELEDDDYIRESYYGGVVICADKFKGRELNFPVYVYDVNSMYPAQMCYKPLPHGKPIFYEGQYKKDDRYPLYIAHIEVSCKLKEGCVATLITKSGVFGRLQYVKDTNGELIDAHLTSVDLASLLDNYTIYEINYINGYKFKSSTTLFADYILPIYECKKNSQGGRKQIYKLKQNSLYGKFAINPVHCAKEPYLKDGIVKYRNLPPKEGKPAYTAVACFITAYARKCLFDAISANLDTFIYCDTDSVHLSAPAKGVDIDDNKLGAWAHEKTYVRSKYLAQKTYMGFDGNKTEKKIAGCPNPVKDCIDFDNFHFSAYDYEKFDGKLLPKTVRGGVVLAPTTFTLKER